ncbi:MAG TPA: hypothetical protein VLM40_23990 [Gemmata sp.]|nr:hypothetical protein [Gemmata sp.]
MFIILVLTALCNLLIALIALLNPGVFVLCLRSKQTAAYIPLVGSLLGVLAVLILWQVVPVPGVSVVVLPLVLLAQRYRGGQLSSARARIDC